MPLLPHPSAFIAHSLVTTIRSYAAEAEQWRTLHTEQLGIIYEQNWFRLFVPTQFKGLECSLPEVLYLEEALAWTDGSLAWTVTLCAGAGWFAGFLDPELGADIFSSDAVCLAGSGKPGGIAKVIDGGYLISGIWDYATGANVATAFTANCMLEENGVLLRNADASPVVLSFLFLKEEVLVHDNWKTIGMIATGSHRFEVRELVVNKNRAFRIDPKHIMIDLPIYHYPFLQLAETTLAVNSSGMARRFMDLCEEICDNKPLLQAVLNNAVQELGAAREVFYHTVHESWGVCVAEKQNSMQLLEYVSAASRQLASISRKQVDELYPLCGMYAANPETEINRVWRNLHTASQHSLLAGRR